MTAVAPFSQSKCHKHNCTQHCGWNGPEEGQNQTDEVPHEASHVANCQRKRLHQRWFQTRMLRIVVVCTLWLIWIGGKNQSLLLQNTDSWCLRLCVHLNTSCFAFSNLISVQVASLFELVSAHAWAAKWHNFFYFKVLLFILLIFFFDIMTNRTVQILYRKCLWLWSCKTVRKWEDYCSEFCTEMYSCSGKER